MTNVNDDNTDLKLIAYGVSFSEAGSWFQLNFENF